MAQKNAKISMLQEGATEYDSPQELALTAENVDFDNSGGELVADNVQDAILEAQATAAGVPRFTVTLLYNATLNNNTFIGYLDTIPGDTSPVIVGRDCILEEFTFSNKNSADFTLELRRNTTTGATFHTVPKTNTQYFVETGITESFSSGDQFYMKYIDDGTNAQDAAIILYFRIDT